MRDCGLPAAARRPAAGRRGGAEIVTAKKFSPDPNERFLKMSWGPGLGPGSRQKSSPQEIVTVRYFPDFSRPEVFERERTVRKLKIAINQL